MRNMSALALGLLIMGLGLYGAAAATPGVFPGAFDAQGGTTNAMALTVMLTITLVSTMFAGFVAARIASDHRPGHAIMMSVLGLTSAVFMGAIRWATAPSWYFIVSWVLIPPAAALGAFAWERSLKRKGRDVARRVATT